MLRYFIGHLAARTATVLFVFVAVLPYLLRRSRLSGGIGRAQADPAPYPPRLRPHFWMGYSLLASSFVHASVAMQPKARTNPVGILAATTAFFLLLGEVVVGLTLKEDRSTTRRPLRRIHFCIMIVFAGALTMHLWLNVS
jgi:Na+/H+ antiporter NhaD/arsenite permease-like protein